MMTVRDYAMGKALNTREGFAFLFDRGMRLCDEYYVPANTLPVEYVLEDLDDCVSNNSTLPIRKILDLSVLPS